VERIVDQKLSLDMVMKLLEGNKDHEDVAVIIREMEDLKKTYDKITIKTSKIEPVTDEATNVTTLKSKTTSNVTAEVFEELRSKIKNIRTSYTL
jgi:hypothetical protein